MTALHESGSATAKAFRNRFTRFPLVDCIAAAPESKLTADLAPSQRLH